MLSYLCHFLIAGIPAALAFACFGPYRRRALNAQRLRSEPLREAVLYLFIVCLFGLAALLLWPPHCWVQGNLVILNARESITDGVNWVPFHMILSYCEALKVGNLRYGLVYFVGNIVMFMPIGFFPPLLFRGQRPWPILCIGLIYSLAAEFFQFFLGRHCDVDDVMLNVIGTILGYLVYRLMRHLFPVFIRRFRCARKK